MSTHTSWTKPPRHRSETNTASRTASAFAAAAAAALPPHELVPHPRQARAAQQLLSLVVTAQARRTLNQLRAQLPGRICQLVPASKLAAPAHVVGGICARIVRVRRVRVTYALTAACSASSVAQRHMNKGSGARQQQLVADAARAAVPWWRTKQEPHPPAGYGMMGVKGGRPLPQLRQSVIRRGVAGGRSVNEPNTLRG